MAGLGKPERTSQGFLRIPAFLTRTGVLEYRRADGSVVRECRLPAEVFHTRSLATLSAAPVTDLHPTQMVTPVNVRELSIGHVSDDVHPDGELVSASVTVQDAKAIEAVERGDRRELSCGYQCRIDETPGTYRGQPYDVVQRDIVYNHVALGPRNWGRAGRDVALRVDAADGGSEDDVFRLDAADALSVATIAAPEGDLDMDMVNVRIDGVDSPAPKQTAQLVEKAITSRDDALVEAVGERDAERGRADALQAEVVQLKAKLAAAEDPKRLDAAVNARSTLVEQAKRVLPADYKFDGLSARDIHEAVLKLDKSELEGQSDEYVAARFDQLMSGSTNSTRNDALDRARRMTTAATPAQAATRIDARPYVPPWRRPLSVSRSR